jgi:hypothetical protein
MTVIEISRWLAAYAGVNPACVSAARRSAEASACKNACTAGRPLRAVTSAKS